MIDLFQELGLSLNEAKIYKSLVKYGGSGVSTISLRAKIHRRNAYDSLQRLAEKGLVYEVFGGKETIFEPVDPSKLMEFVKEKEEKLNNILPDLLEQFTKREVPEQAFIYKGVEGMKNYLRDILAGSEDVYSFAAKGGWFDPKVKPFTDWFVKECKKKGIKYYHIFDHEVEKGMPELPKTVGKPYKFLPKKFSTNSTIDISGDRIMTFRGLTLGKLDEDVKIFVIVSKELAEAYRTWWKLVWELLP